MPTPKGNSWLLTDICQRLKGRYPEYSRQEITQNEIMLVEQIALLYEQDGMDELTKGGGSIELVVTALAFLAIIKQAKDTPSNDWVMGNPACNVPREELFKAYLAIIALSDTEPQADNTLLMAKFSLLQGMLDIMSGSNLAEEMNNALDDPLGFGMPAPTLH